MGLLDSWSQRAAARREERVDYIGEQNGPVEKTLKRELLLEFVTRPDVRRAYLATVRFESEGGPSAAVCIASARPSDQSLIVRVGEICRRLFAKDAVPDVLFVSPEQEAILAQLCTPFYRSAG